MNFRRPGNIPAPPPDSRLDAELRKRRGATLSPTAMPIGAKNTNQPAETTLDIYAYTEGTLDSELPITFGRSRWIRRVYGLDPDACRQKLKSSSRWSSPAVGWRWFKACSTGSRTNR